MVSATISMPNQKPSDDTVERHGDFFEGSFFIFNAEEKLKKKWCAS